MSALDPRLSELDFTPECVFVEHDGCPNRAQFDVMGECVSCGDSMTFPVCRECLNELRAEHWECSECGFTDPSHDNPIIVKVLVAL